MPDKAIYSLTADPPNSMAKPPPSPPKGWRFQVKGLAGKIRSAGGLGKSRARPPAPPPTPAMPAPVKTTEPADSAATGTPDPGVQTSEPTETNKPDKPAAPKQPKPYKRRAARIRRRVADIIHEPRKHDKTANDVDLDLLGMEKLPLFQAVAGENDRYNDQVARVVTAAGPIPPRSGELNERFDLGVNALDLRDAQRRSNDLGMPMNIGEAAIIKHGGQRPQPDILMQLDDAAAGPDPDVFAQMEEQDQMPQPEILAMLNDRASGRIPPVGSPVMVNPDAEYVSPPGPRPAPPSLAYQRPTMAPPSLARVPRAFPVARPRRPSNGGRPIAIG